MNVNCVQCDCNALLFDIYIFVCDGYTVNGVLRFQNSFYQFLLDPC